MSKARIRPTRVCRTAASPEMISALRAGSAADLAALGDIGFEDLGEILGRGVAQRHDLGRRRRWRSRRRRGCGSLPAGDRHHRIDPVSFDQGCAVLVEQGFERRQQGRARQRGAGFDRPGAVDVGVDRVVHLQGRSENCARDLANVGVDKIERDVAALARDPGGAGPVGTARRCRDRYRRDLLRHKGALLGCDRSGSHH